MIAGLSSLLRRLAERIPRPAARDCAPTDLVSLERPQYFPGQLLAAEDFTQEQEYVRERQRRHNRLLHGWGVVCGLEVERAEGWVVRVTPGYALDRNGDEIVIARAVRLDLREHEGLKEGGGAAQLALRYTEYSPREGRTREGAELGVLNGAAEPDWLVLADITVTEGQVSIANRARRLAR